MEGLIIKKNANLFTVYSDGKTLSLTARGVLRKNGLFVGDKVEFSNIIESIKTRKNLLIRPPIANLDKLFIVIAPVPKPDLLLVDKMLIYCYINNVEPILLINKMDIADDKFIAEVEKIYSGFIKIIKISTLNKFSMDKEIKGICALAGQSAVGKSSIINAIVGDNICEVGNLSTKVQRGKQTTRLVELFKVKDGYLADTAGFSMIDLSFVTKIVPRELAKYYPDFIKFHSKCKFTSCLHQRHDKCGVIDAVKEGKISATRYENYLKLYENLNINKKF